MARQIGRALEAQRTKIVNGPEILNKYVGASEEKIRELFADAEKEVCLNTIFQTHSNVYLSIKKKEMRVVCISSSSMNLMLSASGVEVPTTEVVLVILLSTNCLPK